MDIYHRNILKPVHPEPQARLTICLALQLNESMSSSWLKSFTFSLYNSFCLLLLLLAEVTTVAHLPPSNPSILFSSTNLLHVLHYIHVSLSIYLPTHTGHFISYNLLILIALFLCGVASYIEIKSFFQSSIVQS